MCLGVWEDVTGASIPLAAGTGGGAPVACGSGARDAGRGQVGGVCERGTARVVETEVSPFKTTWLRSMRCSIPRELPMDGAEETLQQSLGDFGLSPAVRHTIMEQVESGVLSTRTYGEGEFLMASRGTAVRRRKTEQARKVCVEALLRL